MNLSYFGPRLVRDQMRPSDGVVFIMLIRKLIDIWATHCCSINSFLSGKFRIASAWLVVTYINVRANGIFYILKAFFCCCVLLVPTPNDKKQRTPNDSPAAAVHMLETIWMTGKMWTWLSKIQPLRFILVHLTGLTRKQHSRQLLEVQCFSKTHFSRRELCCHCCLNHEALVQCP